MNNGNYIGRLTKDFTASDSGKTGTGTVAVDRPFPFNKDKDGNSVTDFLNIRIIGADKVNRATQYLTKGTKIAFTGITCRDTTKDKDGNYKEYNYIMVTNWEFAESKNASGNNQQNRPAPSGASSGDDFMQIPDDIAEELPFS